VHPIAQDTGPRQLSEYYRLLREKTPEERLRAASAATRGMRALAEAGIRARDPAADDAAVRRELIRLLYGEAVAARLSGLAAG
jgi:hypothetical protein